MIQQDSNEFGRQLFSSPGQTDVAVQEFGAAISYAPNNAEGYRQLARALAQSGALDGIPAVWQSAISENPNAKWPYRNLANFYHQDGDHTAEALTWQHATDNNPTISWPYRELARVYDAHNQPTRVISTWNQARSRNPDSIWPITHLVDRYQKQNEPELALAIVESAIASNPSNAENYRLLGNVLSEQGQQTEAIEAYQSAVNLEPHKAANYLALGMAAINGHEYELAATAFENALLLEPTQETTASVLDAVKGRPPEEIIESLERVNSADTNNSYVYYALIDLLLQTGDCENAVRYADSAWAVLESIDSALRLNDTYLRCGFSTDSISVLTTAVEKFPLSSPLLLELGKHYLNSGNPQDALGTLARVLELEPTSDTIVQLYSLFATQLPSEQTEEAILATLNAAQVSSPEPYYALSEYYQSTGRAAAGLTVFQTALVYTDAAWPHYELAKLYLEVDAPELALNAYQEALTAEALLMVNPPTQANLLLGGRVYLSTGQFDQGSSLLLQGLTMDPNSYAYRIVRRAYATYIPTELEPSFQEEAALIRWPEPSQAYWALAKWYAGQDKTDVSVALYEKLYASEPSSTAALRQLSTLYLDASECNKAISTGEAVAETDQGSNDYLSLAQTYSECGFDDKAEAAYRSTFLLTIIEESNRLRKRDIINTSQSRFGDVLTSADILNYLAELVQTEQLDDAFPYIQVGHHFADLHKTQEALLIYQNGASHHPENATLQLSLGRLYLEEGDAGTALPALQKAVFLNEKNITARLNLGRALIATGEVEQGISVLETAFSLERADWTADYVVQSYLQNLATVDALPLVLDTLSLVDVEEPYPYENAIQYLNEQGESNLAFAIANQAIETYPDQAWPSITMARLLRGVGKVELAEELLRAQIELHPANAVAHLELGFTLDALERPQESLIEMQLAASLDRKQGWLQIYWGQALLKAERVSDGLAALQTGLRREPTDIAYAYVEGLLVEHVEPSTILDFYVNLFAARPTDPLAQDYFANWRDEVLQQDESAPASGDEAETDDAPDNEASDNDAPDNEAEQDDSTNDDSTNEAPIDDDSARAARGVKAKV